MTNLHRLYAEHGQSPWLDNLTRRYLRDGTLGRMIEGGIRGVTANPTIIAKSIVSSDDYEEQMSTMLAEGHSPEQVFWELAVSDITDALRVLRPVFDASGGTDGFVSIEVAPALARDTAATIHAARRMHQRIDLPNLMVKIPATAEGIPAIRAMVAEGRNINVTLIFSLARYAEVTEAYISGLETFARAGGDPSQVRGVASFFIGRVDRQIDKRLDELGVDRADNLSGWAGVSQARLAYRMFTERFSTGRWAALASQGAQVQRPLWASTSTKNPSQQDTFYVDELIGPDTVTTLQEATISAFEDQGKVARTIDSGIDEAVEVLAHLAHVGIDLSAVGSILESEGLAAFQHSMDSAVELVGSARQRRPQTVRV
jgi:transaldolase